MCSPESPKILYRNPRLLRLAFLQLHHQQQSGVFCDVLLQAEGEAVPAHCCILSACSPFFTERLERERPAQGRKVVLELGGLKIGTLRKLVDFLYTSEMEVSREEAQDVLLAARQLRVSELESLQLEGGKLVRVAQGRRLNRKCLQPPPTAPISARVVGPGRRPRTPLPPPQAACAPGAVKLKLLGKEDDTPKESGGQSAESLPEAKGKARVCPPAQAESSSAKNQAPGPKENRRVPGPAATELFPPSPTVDEPLLPRKIRLSRSKLSPDVCPAKSLGAVAGATPGLTPPGRRLWRQKTLSKEVPEEEPGPGKVGPPEGTASPSLPAKLGTNKKRSPEARAPSSDSAEEGQVGRVKLRKIVNGSCWEVVQESPSRDPQESQQPLGLGGEAAEEAGGLEEEDKPGAEVAQCPLDAPACTRLQEALTPTGQFPEQAEVKAECPDVPDMVEKAAMLSGDCREPYEFVPALLGQPCEAEEYRITSAAATSELEEILDFMLCDSDIGPSVDSLESPRAGNSKTPPFALTEPEKTWAEGEEWCLPEVELWPRDFPGLEKDSDKGRDDKGPGEPLSSLVASQGSEGEELAVPPAWTSEAAPGDPRAEGQGDKLLCSGSPIHFHAPYGDLSPPCASWVDTGYGKASVVDDTLYPEGEPGVTCPEIKEVLDGSSKLSLSPGSLEEEGEIDVVDWTAQVGQVPFHGLSVWPDPSSESETEVDVLT
ncbi:BTB/POZ domain-containing protein 18 [Gracilinanus agilis]|uniref:BTB/POZ domain-containing protein 18 n=1 Tax=Gracilinanus agilis TaxID=191870 RepID=UPI001CFE59D5|nr:BTB/POZ domain-containing protein 18 [Gracilinanus agilis]